jgi:hypothetical protein
VAQGSVTLPDDSGNTGKKEDHWITATSSQYREAIVVADPSVDAAVSKVQNGTPATTDYGLTVRPITPDGIDVTQGALADAAVTGDNTGSLSAKLRGLSKIFADVWDSGNHWLKVSIQNATLAVTQSGTWTVQPGNTANTTPWLATIQQGGNPATVSGAGALKVDGSAVTQPVSLAGSGSLTLQASQVSGVVNATTTRTTTTGLDLYNNLAILINITNAGAATGTLQLFLEDSIDGGTTWDDLVSSPTFTFGGSLTTWLFVIAGHLATSRPQGQAAQQETLAAQSARQGAFGERIRVREKVSGVGGSPTGVTYTITAVAKR